MYRASLFGRGGGSSNVILFTMIAGYIALTLAQEQLSASGSSSLMVAVVNLSTRKS